MFDFLKKPKRIDVDDINLGLKFNNPPVFVPWCINQKQLEKIFKKHDLKRISDTYYSVPCEIFDGLKCIVCFHFRPITNSQLMEFEITQKIHKDMLVELDFYQGFLEKKFGKGTPREKEIEGFPLFQWKIGFVEITNCITERHTQYHSLRIEKVGR